MDADDIRLEFIDKLYAVAMEPERFTELMDIWHGLLSQASGRDAKTFARDMQTFEAHIRRAESLFSMVATSESLLPASLTDRLRAEPQATVIVDGDGTVRALNDAARQVLDVEEGGHCADLSFDPDTMTVLRERVEGLSQDDASVRQPLILRAWRGDARQSSIISLTCWTTGSAQRLLVVRTIDFAWPAHLTELVQSAFALTRAEATVMRLLAEGNSANDIARLRRASIATVRSQIRAIYAKTSTRNQSEFMRMTLGLASVESAGASSVPAKFDAPCRRAEPPHPLDNERHLFRLSDGRILDYADFGADDGAPCLNFHSEFFGDGWTAAMVRLAAEQGLRIITPARPFNGRSSPYPEGSNPFAQVVMDIAELLDGLGIEHAAHLSFMAGTAYSLAMAGALPERTQGLVIIAPTFPFDAPGVSAELPYFHRVLAGVLHGNERLLEFLCRSGMAFQNRAGTRRFFEAFARQRPADLAVVQSGEFFPAIEHGARLCGAQGHLGFFNDYRCALDDPWSRFEALTHPVHVLAGKDSTSSTVKALRLLAQRHAHYRFQLLPGGAHYLQYSHHEAVLKALRSLWPDVRVATAGQTAADES